MSRASAPAGRTRKRRYHHGDLRRALVEEALRTIAADGPDALTLRGVGEALGVSRTALYRHFADKADLLSTVATEGFRRLADETLEAWEHAGGGDAGLKAMGRAYVRFATASPAHYRVMFGPFVDGHDGGHPELEAEGERAFRVLVDALLILQRDGIVRPDDAVLAARYIWATVHGVAMLAIDGRLGNQPSITQLTEFAVERIRDAIDRGRPVRRHPHPRAKRALRPEA